MLWIYAAALAVGGTLLGASLLGHGHDSGGHGGHPGHDAHDGHDSRGAAALAAFFSLRTWTYFTAFGGLAGVALHLVAHTPEPLAALLSAGTGLSSAALARFVIARANGDSPSGTSSERDLAGRTAEVVVPFSGRGVGKVRATVLGNVVDLLASADDLGDYRQSDAVVIVELKDDTARVVRAPPGPPGDETV